MKHLLLAACVAMLATACASPNKAVAVSGFKFADYDYVVVSKPQESALYGMDVELANLLEGHGLTSIGDKAYAQLSPKEQRATLNARLALLSNNDKKNLLAVSFENAQTGKTGLSISEVAKGDIFDNGDRRDAFAKLSKAIEFAIKPEIGALNAKRVERSVAAAKAAEAADKAAAQAAAEAAAKAAEPLPAPVAIPAPADAAVPATPPAAESASAAPAAP